MPTAALLLNVLNLVQAGFALTAIVAKVQDLQAKGATDSDVARYLKNLRDAALNDLAADVAPK